jgi:hypothetical protein
MAETIGVLAVSVEPVEFEYGGWCQRCLLPSGVRITAMVTLGPSSTLRTFDRCTDCLGSHVDPPETPSAAHH